MMNNDLGLGIVVSMKDAFSSNAKRIQSSMTDLDTTVASASERMTKNLDRIQKGTMMVGAGLALMAAPAALIASTAATQKALGELSSLGVKDLRAIENASESFSNKWSGGNKSDFIAATYDVKSALSNLSDEAVGVFTSMAALTGKATKATTQEMVGTFTTAYGIFRPIMSDMTDMEWATAFSGAMAQTVASFKTNGAQMADAIKNIGAVAASSNVPLQEQLAVLGQLQTTMPGAQAGTLYKSFIMKAAEAGDKLGLSFTDSAGRLKGVLPILQEIKRQFPDLSQAAAQVKLKKAFGSDEAVKFVLQMSTGMETLEGSIKSVEQAMRGGTAVTEEMANAMNQDIGARFTLLKQQMLNLYEILGRTLLPVITPIVSGISRFILFLQRLAKSMPGVTRVVLSLSMALGAVLVIAGTVTAAIGMVGVMLPAIKAGIIAIGAAAGGLGASIATYFLPVTVAIAGVVLAVYLLKKAWGTNFGGIRDIVSSAWNRIKLVFDGVKALVASLASGAGQMSAELANKLKSAGLLGFAVTAFKVYYRVREYMAGLFGAVSHAFGRIRAILEPTIRTLLTAFGSLYKAIAPVVDIFGMVTNSADSSSWRTLGAVIGTVAGVLLQGVAFALKIVIWNFSLVVRTLAVVVKAVVWVGNMIVSSLVYAGKFIYKFLLPVRLIAQAFIAAGKIIYSVWQVLTGDVSLLDGLKSIGGAVFDFIATPFKWARDVVLGLWNFIKGTFNAIGSFFTNAANLIVSAFLNLPVISTLRNMFGTISSFFAGDITFFEAGKKILIAFGKGIWSAVTYPFRMLKNALGKLRSLLPFSDANEGPLSNLTASGSALLKTLADGMKSSQSLPAKVFSFAAKGIMSSLAFAWSAVKSGGEALIGAVAAPFKAVGGIWNSLTVGAKGAVDFINGTVSSIIPEINIPNSWSSVWEGLSSGAVAFSNRIASTFSGLKGVITGAFSAIASKGSTLWESLKSGTSGVLQSLKEKAAGFANSALNKVRAFFSPEQAPEAKAAPQIIKQEQPGKSIAGRVLTDRVLDVIMNIIPEINLKLIPKALTAALLLNPVMSGAAVIPDQVQSVQQIQTAQPMAVQTSATPIELFKNIEQLPEAVSVPRITPLNMPAIPSIMTMQIGATAPDLPMQKSFEPSPETVVRTEKLAAVRNINNESTTVKEIGDAGIKGILEAILNSLEGLKDRPIEVSVTTNIDGRQVAETVYKDLRERRIRNYETL